MFVIVAVIGVNAPGSSGGKLVVDDIVVGACRLHQHTCSDWSTEEGICTCHSMVTMPIERCQTCGSMTRRITARNLGRTLLSTVNANNTAGHFCSGRGDSEAVPPQR